MIYKICDRAVWQAATDVGSFSGVEVDLKDGFIHFSAAHQVKETAAKHFSGQKDLLLIEFDENQLGENLKWEVSRGGDRFPHLYGTLNTSHACRTLQLPIGADGKHQFPEIEE